MENSQDESESDEQEQFLEMKPLRSLAPMFPLPMGYDVATQSTDPMLVFVTPFRPCTSPEQSPASFGQPLPKSPIPLKATPVSTAFPMPRHKGGSSQDPLKDTPMSEAFPMPRHKDEPSDDPLKATPISAAFPMPRHKDESSDDPLKATPVSAAFRMPRHKDKSSDDPLKATPMSR
jgi:euchromatic histone-lysine N-methyltransferase